jgi:hypothetical protein
MVVRHFDFSDRESIASKSVQAGAAARREKRALKNWKPIVVSRSISHPYQCHCADVSRGLVNLCGAHMLSNYLPQSSH